MRRGENRSPRLARVSSSLPSSYARDLRLLARVGLASCAVTEIMDSASHGSEQGGMVSKTRFCHLCEMHLHHADNPDPEQR